MDGPVDTCLGVRAVRRATPRATRCLSLLEQLLPVAAEELVKARPEFGLGDAARRRRATQQHTWQANPQFPSTFGFDAQGVMSCLDLGECKLHRLTERQAGGVRKVAQG